MRKRYLLYVACALVLIGLACMLPVAAGDTGRIAFESDRDGHGTEIYVMNADGTGVTRLTDNTDSDGEPAFSPDGTRIAFVSNRDDHSELRNNKDVYVMNADGTGQTRLTSQADMLLGGPAWSPDGNRIAYHTCGKVWMMNADGTNNVLIADQTVDYLLSTPHPTWSPDGDSIAVSWYYPDIPRAGWEISVLHSDGTPITRLTFAHASCDAPAWSPDGTRIAFQNFDINVENAGGIYVVDPDGSSDPTRLTNDGGISHNNPAWSPDSSKIAYDAYGDIYVMNADGTGVTPLTTDADHYVYDGHPSWVGTAVTDPVPPTAAFTLIPSAPTTLDSIKFTDASSDPDGTVVGWSWDFGDGDTSTEQHPEHSYGTAGTYTVSLTVTDSDALTATVNHDVTVTSAPTPENRAPIAVLNAYGMDEDTSLTVTADEGVLVNDVDADGDALTAALVSGPAHGTVTLNADGSFTYTPTADFSGEDTFTYRANDGALDSNTVTVTITVRPVNDPPVVAGVTVPASPVPLGSPVTVTASFTDDSAAGTHTATWAWGDGTTSPGTVAAGVASGTHPYAAAGVYEVTVTVTDDDGAAGSATAQSIVVVYDPNGGFVTGSGWITSPVGAYPADPALTGKANFGFVSKYQKGANLPSGETQFVFSAADFTFRSTSYDWLVVAGAKAQFKGTGTVNGTGEYGFLLTATDGQVTGGGGTDKFRLKVWEKATGTIVYDNQLGATDGADPATVLGGGSIVVHKK
ncbi:MAG: PKD domain-containing protein [Methanospirillum sp.]